MLSALVYLNPDSKERCTKWIDPILADAQDRREWEAAILLSCERRFQCWRRRKGQILVEINS